MSGLLLVHISAGTVALVSGLGAVLFRKGEGPHRASGTVFFVSMLIMASSGAYIAYTKPVMISVVVGLLTLYMVATARAAAKRVEKTVGPLDVLAMVYVLAVGAAALAFGVEASMSEAGTKDGFPAVIFYIFGSIAVLAGVADATVILRRGVAGRQRIARHVWRMTFALYIATSSFFLGQAKVFPEAVRESPVLYAPPLIVLAVMIFWLIRVLCTKWVDRGGAPAPHKPTVKAQPLKRAITAKVDGHDRP